MAQGVWTIAEQRDGAIRKITYEIVSEGRRLADALGQELDRDTAWFQYKRQGR